MKMEDSYIGCAENKQDVQSAIKLIKKVFYLGTDSNKFIFPKEHLVEKNVVVVKVNKKVIATSLINDRIFYLNNLKISCSFLSFICVNESYRDKGFSKELMDFSIQLCVDRGKKACFVIARKSVDYYYNKFSFYGFSNYPKIIIKNGNIPFIKKLNFVPLELSSINEIKETYHAVYNKLFGSFYRNNENWNFILKKARKINVEVCMIRDVDDETLGYICFDKGNIYEIALNSQKDYPEVLKNIMDKQKLDLITFHGSTNHPLANKIEYFDHTVSYRKCWHGGHMIRINDEEMFSSKLSKQKPEKIFNKENDYHEGLNQNYLLKDTLSFEADIFSDHVINIPLMDQI
jgi:predicted acetyltransferase